MDHDRLFKELISAFFVEFVELLLPEIASYVDPQAVIVPLDKEIFTDVTVGDKHEVDLVASVSDDLTHATLANVSLTRPVLYDAQGLLVLRAAAIT